MLGTFRLGPEQALVLDLRPPATRYWSVTVENIWHECIDARRRRSSITNAAAIAEADGTVRIVVRAQDPGHANWIDTGGRHRGFVTLRWLASGSAPCLLAPVHSRGAGRMIGSERLDQDRLLTDAISIAGSDDLGEPTWGEGLAVLLDSLAGEAQLNDIGVEVVATELTAYLANRLAITAWRREHQTVAKGKVTAPIVIVGQPRTGTTILFDLLAQDPELRAPLTWEVDRPVPAPTAATYVDDPRIAEVQATIELTDSLIPGFTTFHPMGGTVGSGVRQDHRFGIPEHDLSYAVSDTELQPLASR